MAINQSFMQSSASANNPLLGLTKKPVTPTAPSNAGTPINKLGLTGPTGIGQKALSPTQNLKPTTNTLSSGFQAPNVATPTPQSTANGTQNNMQSQLDAIKQSALGIQAQLAKPTTPAPVPQYTANNGLYGELITGLANRYTQPSQDYQNAQKQAQDILAQQKELDTNYAKQTYNIETGSGDLSLAGGLQGQLNRLAAAKSGALASQYAGATNLLGAANTQQQMQQGALGAAAGLAQPQGANALGFYDPVTKQFTPYGGGSNQSGAFGAGQVSGNVELGAQYSQMNAANTAAKGYENTINTYLRDNPQLNPSDLTAVNGVAQWLKGQVGDPKYQTLANYINEYANTLAPILGAGGSVTDYKTGLAQSLVNGRATGQSISEVLANISKAADDKLANMRSAGTGGGVVAGGSAGYQPTTGGNTFGSFFGQ